MSHSPATRPSLLVRLRDSRDAEAWAQFTEIYAPLIFWYGRKHGLQDADAADLTQDVLRRVATNSRDWRYDPKRGSFRGWLLTVVRNRLCDAWRRPQVDRGTGDTAAQLLLNEQPARNSDEQWWEQQYQQQLFAAAAERVRTGVSPTTWEAFAQTSVEGRPAGQVAEGLGLSVAAVYLAKGRVIRRLKLEIQKMQLK